MPSGNGAKEPRAGRGRKPPAWAVRWFALAKATVERVIDCQLTDRAATLAYYSFLSLFPALIVGVALLAILGTYPGTYNDIIGTLREAAPGPAINTIDGALRNVLRDSGSAGSLLGIGLVTALFTASGATGAAIRALEVIDPKADGRDLVKSTLTRLGMTIALMLLIAVAFAALLLAGPLFAAVSDAAGLGTSAQTTISILRWPVGLAALLGAILILYIFGPGHASRSFIQHLPGALLAATLAIVASILFSIYVANFGSYDATYGTLGAVIVLLTWLYVGNLALLVGACLNVELRAPAKRGAAKGS